MIKKALSDVAFSFVLIIIFLAIFSIVTIMMGNLDLYVKLATNFPVLTSGLIFGLIFGLIVRFVASIMGTMRRINKIVEVTGIEPDEASALVTKLNYKSYKDPEDWDLALFNRDYQKFKLNGEL